MTFLAVSVSAQAVSTRRTVDEGATLARAGQYEQALEIFQNARRAAEIEKPGGDLAARIRFNIGVCLYRMQRPQEAVEAFGEAIEMSRGDYQKAFYALGMAEAALKHTRQAIEAFRRAVALKRSDAEAWFDLGLSLIDENEFPAAREAFENSIRYKTSSRADAHNNVGVVLALGGDFAAAEKRFKVALRVSGGKSVEARNNLQFCRIYGQNSRLAAKFEFSRNQG
jgi:tetratricopeptide (TPR) repeat protein